jgi:hypothetical protein
VRVVFIWRENQTAATQATAASILHDFQAQLSLTLFSTSVLTMSVVSRHEMVAP